LVAPPLNAIPEAIMPRFKPVHYDQTLLIPLSFSQQIFPGSFEHTLHHIVDHELDLSIFDSHYRNDHCGAPAWHPAVMLKITCMPIRAV
jgi:hypothetical protein